MKTEKKGITGALSWKILERLGVHGVQFVLQIIMARILAPEHYGVLSLMVIFTTLANVFIQRGFNAALVQNKDVTDDDCSSVFWVTLGIAAMVYTALFALAPAIANFYNMADFVLPFRVLCLMLFPGALNSVQLAIISRRLDFKQVFYSNLAAIIAAGAVGVALAYMGAGLWALVAQNLTSVCVACVVMFCTVKWRPRLVLDLQRVKVLFSFGWKLLASGLLDTLYGELRSLVIGKKYNSDMLGYYNRGKQFPQYIIDVVNNSVQSVLLPAMSAEQDDKAKVKTMVRNSVMLISYIIFPMMAGLAAVATSLITLLLTEKWLPCVPYMQIYCFTLAFYPINSSNVQAINAMGRSDIFLKLEVIKKAFGIAVLTIAVVCFDSPLAIAATGVITSLISCFVNAYPNKKLIGYSYFEQIRDILPSLLISLFMLGIVLAVELLQLNAVATMGIQIVIGIVLYVLLSALLRVAPFRMLLGALKDIRHKR